MTQITFLMDSDPKPGASGILGFFGLAAKYFTQIGAPPHVWAPGSHSLEEVFAVLRVTKPVPSIINIVSHATGFGSLSFPLTTGASKQWIESSDLAKALNPDVTPLRPLAVDAITGSACVVIYGCDVGRSSEFIRLLGLLFSRPVSIVAPRRIATFTTDSSGVAYYRLSQSWSVPSIGLPPMPTATSSSLWDPFRIAFVDRATAVFGSLANRVKDLGSDDLQHALTALVTHATDTSGNPEFFAEGIFGLSKAAVDTLEPLVNADPAAIGVPPDPLQADDAWQATRLSLADAVLRPGSKDTWDVTTTVLTSLIPREVIFADPTSFCTWYFLPPLAPGKPAPSIPANPPSGGPTPPPAGSDVGSLTDQLVAAGLAQTDLDSLLATLVPPVAGDDNALIAADPDAPPVDDADDDNIDQPQSLEDV